ncbi:MAG: sulfotransferase family protein [Saprospiraceae bacterium]|nr:sulfotransferase family protein [Saprospiraceae bacterium]
MSLEIIGVGFGRTGTHSFKLALEHLGYPCYHMEDLIRNPDDLSYWIDAKAGREVRWDELFSGYRAVCDFPANLHYESYMKLYPEARFVLTTRDPESWHKSFGDTIIRQSNPSFKKILATSIRLPFDARLRKRLKVFKFAGQNLKEFFKGDFYNEKREAIQFFKDWNAKIKRTIPRDKLLEFNVKDGWGPLCQFLGHETPSVPFPRSNSTSEFNARAL